MNFCTPLWWNSVFMGAWNVQMQISACLKSMVSQSKSSISILQLLISEAFLSISRINWFLIRQLCSELLLIYVSYISFPFVELNGYYVLCCRYNKAMWFMQYFSAIWDCFHLHISYIPTEIIVYIFWLSIS